MNLGRDPFFAVVAPITRTERGPEPGLWSLDRRFLQTCVDQHLELDIQLCSGQQLRALYLLSFDGQWLELCRGATFKLLLRLAEVRQVCVRQDAPRPRQKLARAAHLQQELRRRYIDQQLQRDLARQYHGLFSQQR